MNFLTYPVRLLLATVLTVLILTPCILLHFFSADLTRKFISSWARLMLAVFQVKLEEIHGVVPPSPVLFIQLNQFSLIDALVIGATLPATTHVLVNFEFALIPFIGWGLALNGGIVVRRESLHSSQKAFQKCNRLLKKKENITLSIEGQRSRDATLSPFKKGPVIMAKRNRAAIVPISIHGSEKVLPYGAFKIRPGAVKIVYHQPLLPEKIQTTKTGTILVELESKYQVSKLSASANA